MPNKYRELTSTEGIPLFAPHIYIKRKTKRKSTTRMSVTNDGWLTLSLARSLTNCLPTPPTLLKSLLPRSLIEPRALKVNNFGPGPFITPPSSPSHDPRKSSSTSKRVRLKIRRLVERYARQRNIPTQIGKTLIFRGESAKNDIFPNGMYSVRMYAYTYMFVCVCREYRDVVASYNNPARPWTDCQERWRCSYELRSWRKPNSDCHVSGLYIIYSIYIFVFIIFLRYCDFFPVYVMSCHSNR